MCNASLQHGILPTTQRSAVVTPRLKKAGSDPADVRTCNYRPISNLAFMSKVVERLVCRQLVAYLEQNGLLPDLQSAYRRCRSTKTAVLKVVADLFTAADRDEVTFLCLLDLSAAFDTVNHDILIDRLNRAFGFRDDVLSWITSFVTGRTQRVRVGGQYSTYSAVQHGVPQGSVLGPILFLLYTANVLVIAARHGVSVHSYADDTQLYLNTSADNCEATFARYSLVYRRHRPLDVFQQTETKFREDTVYMSRHAVSADQSRRFRPCSQRLSCRSSFCSNLPRRHYRPGAYIR